MDIRQLQYLVALAQEKHFTRAAEVCHVTQPTLSGRIRQLEQELGVPIVLRGKRFHGLTPEGERVLKWARKILENCDGLREELGGTAGLPAGRLVIGVIPSAAPIVPPLTSAIRAGGAPVRCTVLNQSSTEITRALETFEIDAGITYLDNEPVDLSLSAPLYTERYRLFMRPDHPLAAREAIHWAEAAEHMSCALTPNMQNRRIIDAAFAEAGAPTAPVVESTSAVTLLAHVRLSGMVCVLPEYFLGITGSTTDLVARPLVRPEVSHTVGLVAQRRDPLPRLIGHLMSAAKKFELPESLTAPLATG